MWCIRFDVAVFIDAEEKSPIAETFSVRVNRSSQPAGPTFTSDDPVVNQAVEDCWPKERCTFGIRTPLATTFH